MFGLRSIHSGEPDESLAGVCIRQRKPQNRVSVQQDDNRVDGVDYYQFRRWGSDAIPQEVCDLLESGGGYQHDERQEYRIPILPDVSNGSVSRQ